MDLTIGAITQADIPTLHPETTAANLANIASEATECDLALGLVNMVLQTIFTLGIFAARGADMPCSSIVLTGSLTALPQIGSTIEAFSLLYPNEFIMPEHAAFATAIGAALHGFDD